MTEVVRKRRRKKSKDRGASKEVVAYVMKAVGDFVHCGNCQEDREEDGVIVRPAGDDRFFIFCSFCEMDIRLVELTSKPIVTNVQSADVPAASTQLSPTEQLLMNRLNLLEAENTMLKTLAAQAGSSKKAVKKKVTKKKTAVKKKTTVKKKVAVKKKSTKRKSK